VLVATNQDLQALQDFGKFRKDLYFRLYAHHIHIPPLRERREDLNILVDHFLGKASETLSKKKPTPPKELFTLLSTYHFPGNIRELQSMILDAVSSHKSGKLSMDVFKSYICQKQPTVDTDFKNLLQRENILVSFPEQLPTLKQTERLLISEAMRRANNNQAIAAQLLGITRQALNKRLKTTSQ
jgi:transcriptional regulator with PAS, ATPase and Fis domain